MSARRFLARWSMRVLRTDSRQYAMIFATMFIGVAVSVGGAIAAFNLVEPPQSEFGNGTFGATTSQPAELERSLIDQGIRFGQVESATLMRDGTTERVTTRVVDPDNPVTAPLLVLLDGRWPTENGEVAVTDRALLDSPAVGGRIELGGQDMVIVGRVENPTSLADEFALATSLDGFGLDDAALTTEFLIDAPQSDVDFSAVQDYGTSSTEGPSVRTALTMVVTVVGALGMLEIALLVGSAFAVIARGRYRQLGLLAAIGATPKLVRTAATLVGALLGLAAALLGIVVGIAVTSLVVPAMETTVGHRIAFAVPLWAVAPNAIIVLFVASMAARRPSKAVSERSVVAMLAAGRPAPEPVGRSTGVGVVLAGIGAAALIIGFTRLSLPIAVLGTVTAPIGLLLISPLLVAVVGRLATDLPLAERLAGRTLTRYRRRSASTVAAIALALAIPVGIAVVTTSIDKRAETSGPNLAPNWMVVWAPGAEDHAVQLPVDLDATALTASVDAMRLAAPELDFVPIEMAIPADSPIGPWEFSSLGEVPSVAPVGAGEVLEAECAFCNSDAYGFGERDENGHEISYLVRPAWVASSPLLGAIGLDDAWLGTASTALVEDDHKVVVSIEGILARAEQVEVGADWPLNTTVPSVLISPDLVADSRFAMTTVGWLGVADEPISTEVQESVRDAAVGTTLEFHVPPDPKSGLRAVGLLIGLLIGFGIALSAVALLAAELANDLTVLSAIGASPHTARRLFASLAAMLAGIGALLAIAIGYLPLLPMVTSRADNFPFVVPWLTLVGLVVLLPVIAWLAGWMLSRRPVRGVALRESY